MKKNITVILTILVMTFTTLVNVKAAVTASASVSNPIYVGQSGTITFSVPQNYGFDVNVSNSNPDVLSMSHSDLINGKIISFMSNKVVINVKGLKNGSTTIKFSGTASNQSGVVEEINPISVVVNITDKPKPGPEKPSNPGGGGGGYVPPKKDNTEEEKKNNQISEEQKKKQAEEKRLAELEEKKKNPLISSIGIISESEKMNGDLIDTIKSEYNVFEYSTVLPRDINSVNLDIQAEEGAELIFDPIIDLNDNQESVIVEIKAIKDEVEQIYKIKVDKNNVPLVKRELDGKTYNVNDDGRLIEAMKKIDFDSVNEETIGLYFNKNNVNIQLVEKDDGKSQFFLLDENLQLSSETNLLLNDSDVFLTTSLNDISDNTFNGNSSINAVVDFVNEVPGLEYLDFDNQLEHWEFDEGYILYGMFSDSEPDTYFTKGIDDETKENSLVKVLVAFDSKDQNVDVVKLISVIGFSSLLLTNITYFIVKYTKKRKQEY